MSAVETLQSLETSLFLQANANNPSPQATHFEPTQQLRSPNDRAGRDVTSVGPVFLDLPCAGEAHAYSALIMFVKE
jgi:hypothetical protein